MESYLIDIYSKIEYVEEIILEVKDDIESTIIKTMKESKKDRIDFDNNSNLVFDYYPDAHSKMYIKSIYIVDDHLRFDGLEKNIVNNKKYIIEACPLMSYFDFEEIKKIAAEIF